MTDRPIGFDNLYQRKLREIDQSLIFIHIPKTGGRALAKAYRVNNTPDVEWLNVMHTPAHRVKERFPEGFEKGFVFTIIRNPIARFLSACKYNKVTDKKDIETLSELMVNGSIDYVSKFNLLHIEHFFTQSNFVKDHEGNVIVDYIGIYEGLSTVIGRLKEEGLDLTNDFEVKTGDSNKWGSKLTKKAIANIKQIYAEDFELYKKVKGNNRDNSKNFSTLK